MTSQPGGDNEPAKPSGGRPKPPGTPRRTGANPSGGRPGAAKRNGSGSGSSGSPGSGSGSPGSGGRSRNGSGASRNGGRPGGKPKPSATPDPAPAAEETATDLPVRPDAPADLPGPDPEPVPVGSSSRSTDAPAWTQPKEPGGSVSAARTGPQPAVRADDPLPSSSPSAFGGPLPPSSAGPRTSGQNRVPGFGASLRDRFMGSPSRPSDSSRPGSGGATGSGGKPARKAQLQLARLEPWSVMKFSFMMSLVCFVVLIVAVVVLYAILAGLGVFDAIGDTVNSVTKNPGDNGGVDAGNWFSFSRVFGYTVLVGALNVLLITALSTVGSVIYNLAADVVGGIEVTLKEAE
ncbi:hypothetical protein BTM25_06750 [Actinomadura rubteroloni]|uniref:DUF3566 domain-containing protein n=1 Tax=Actinomadura rubteroloni TaxID=1926885 RepID=A0A2P4UMK8_9ACTN|nr:DUF3566 domain-containing protein [Actinomadura rubteroloni]POM26281.1 hypothetical protein BTM25_06750 [Actinomadura rubteroloni]